MKDAYTHNDIQKIAVPMSDGLLFVDIQQLVMLEADRVYTNLFLNDQSKLTVSKPLRTFEDILSERVFIFRPHRSFLINIHHVKKYLRGEFYDSNGQ